MRIVIAPDKFKGSLTADEVARAMARGARQAVPSADVVGCPVADGGEGTRSLLLRSLGGTTEYFRVPGPLGETLDAPVSFLNDATAVVEAADASGLSLIPPERRDPVRATSFGTGALIQAAFNRRPRPPSILVCIGGTASTDGGAGAAAACGWSFTDADGHPIDAGGGALRHLDRIGRPDRPTAKMRVIGACDVDVPLTGDRGAARVFAPQKGAGADEVAVLEDGLENLVRRMREDVGFEVEGVAHAGAGGGLGAGIAAFFGGMLRAGFDVVAEAVGLSAHIEGADLVVTGEGRLDRQSLEGKTTVGVAGLARSAGVPCCAVAGRNVLAGDESSRAHFAATADLTDLYGERAKADPRTCVSEATRAMVASVLA